MALTNIVAGDTFTYQITNSDYEGYTFHLKLGGTGTIAIEATELNGVYTFSELPTATKLWDSGTYNYVIIAENGVNEYSIETGQLKITLRVDLAINTDVRTHARKVLDAIEAVLENRASKDQENYSIAGRSLTRTSIEDLLKFRRLYRAEVKAESGTAKRRIVVGMQ